MSALKLLLIEVDIVGNLVKSMDYASWLILLTSDQESALLEIIPLEKEVSGLILKFH